MQRLDRLTTAVPNVTERDMLKDRRGGVGAARAGRSDSVVAAGRGRRQARLPAAAGGDVGSEAAGFRAGSDRDSHAATRIPDRPVKARAGRLLLEYHVRAE